MTTLSYPNNLTNGTTADADEVMGNFNEAKNVINGNITHVNTGIFGGNIKFSTGYGLADSNGVPQILLTLDASAVNYLNVGNAATGNAPSISAAGSDTDISINLVPKGAGLLTWGGANLLRTDTYAEDTYSTEVSVGTTNDVAWGDVDATNMAISFNVSVTGKWKVEFEFNFRIAGSVNNELVSHTGLRLTDGTTDGPLKLVGIKTPPVTGSSGYLDSAVLLSHVFDYSSTGTKTVKLQKYNLVSTNILERSVNNSNSLQSVCTMRAYRIAD